MILLVVLIIFHFALAEQVEQNPQLAAGAFWVALFFAAVLGQSRTFVAERERGCLTGLILTPADRSAIYVAKVIVNLLFIGLVEVSIIPLFALLYQLPQIARPGQWFLLLVSVTLGLSIVGTLLSSLGLSARNRELLFPILLFPLLVPILISAVEGTVALLPDGDLATSGVWLRLVIGYDIVFFSLSIMLFDFALGE